MLSFKLARSNLRKNLKSFAPFILSCVTFFVILFVTASIMLSPSLAKMYGGGALAQLLIFAFIILAIFSVIVLIYSYRFLQLRRTREFGLYDILGFGKNNVTAVSFWELVLCYITTIISGTIIGFVFAKFIFLIYVNLIGRSDFKLSISPLSLLLVAGVFIGIFILLGIISASIIARSSSLNLLKQADKGEKEPRTNLIMAGLSIVLLAVGYKIALSVQNPVQALTQFFIAVLLVIFGTYFFYISFTIWYLKWRKKKRSYYQPRNFITISSMLYRMKANAVGLASITILLSMTIVTIIVTVSLFVGSDRTVRSAFAREGQIATSAANISSEQLSSKLKNLANSTGVQLTDMANVEQVTADVQQKASNKTTFKAAGAYPNTTDKELVLVTLTSVESLKVLGVNPPSSLANGQIALYDIFGNTKSVQDLDWYGHHYQVNSHLSSIGKFPVPPSNARSLLVVFNSKAALNKAAQQYQQHMSKYFDKFSFTIDKSIFFDINKENQKTLSKAFKDSKNNKDVELSFLSEKLQTQHDVTGGFVFVGFVLGLSFILGAALIIYYKQLSEGMQDQRSFKILQEVGLSKLEVAQTIKTQVRTIFFLPIIVAIIHFAFAYNMVSKITNIFNINVAQMVIVNGAAIVGIIVIYWAIYKVTSRVYYNIVER